MTKEEMLKEIAEQLQEVNATDNIKSWCLNADDDGGYISLAHCSNKQMLRFLTMGIITLAKRQGFSVNKVAVDVANIAALIEIERQKNKEND